jgi:BNR repeat protein
MRTLLALIMGIGCLTAFAYAQAPQVVENVIVYKETDRFAGWPANNGIWNWGDEIVVGFTLGWHDDDKQGGHPIDGARPSTRRQARSLDGGRTWTIEAPSFLDADGNERDPVELSGPIDFTHPDFALQVRMGGSNAGFSRFVYSYRCKTWEGPFDLPTFDRLGIMGRTDYIVNGEHDLFMFLTSAKDKGNEGWPFCARTTDGGMTWDFVAWIGEQPPVDDYGYSIMPSSLHMKNGALLSIIRRGGRTEAGDKDWWIESFLSPDDGVTWYMLDEPRIPNKGNPPHMIRLRDGRIVLTYGWRDVPYGVRAIISNDEGVTWSDEIVLRDDGGGWDLGYPRTVQRADGKIVTTYYFNAKGSKERHIAGTIWDPGTR